MTRLIAVVLVVSFLVVPAFADGPVEFEGTKPVDSENPKLHSRQRDGGSFTKKPEVVLSTVGPVPVGTVPPVPGSNNNGGVNLDDVDVFVGAPNLPNRGGGPVVDPR